VLVLLDPRFDAGPFCFAEDGDLEMICGQRAVCWEDRVGLLHQFLEAVGQLPGLELACLGFQETTVGEGLRRGVGVVGVDQFLKLFDVAECGRYFAREIADVFARILIITVRWSGPCSCSLSNVFRYELVALPDICGDHSSESEAKGHNTSDGSNSPSNFHLQNPSLERAELNSKRLDATCHIPAISTSPPSLHSSA